jgi:hypothetical protein
MKYSKGVMWLDDCRIPYSVNDDERIGKGYLWDSKAEPFGEGKTLLNKEGWDVKGRFTPNLLVCDDMLNDGSVSNSSSNERKNNITQKIYGGGKGIPPQTSKGFDDKGTNSRYYDLDKWFDKVIDEIQ